jgi:hypothetical protein
MQEGYHIIHNWADEGESNVEGKNRIILVRH